MGEKLWSGVCEILQNINFADTNNKKKVLS